MLQFRHDDAKNPAAMTARVGDYVLTAARRDGSAAWTITLSAGGCARDILSVEVAPPLDATPEHVAGVALDHVLRELYGRSTAYQKVAAALSAAADEGDAERPYVAVVRASACRDAQVASTPDAELLDDDAWRDATDAEIFVGVFFGTRETVLRMAANFAGVHDTNIRLIPASDARGTT